MHPNHLILAGQLGSWQLLIVLFIVLLLFGRRLPALARSLGQGISSFKKGLSEPVDTSGETDADAAPGAKSAKSGVEE